MRATDASGLSEGDAETLRQWVSTFGDEAPDAPVFEQTEISELLPEPTTYSLALFESLWGVGGAVDRACRATGFAYRVGLTDRPLVVTAFGRSFVDRREWHRRCQQGLSALASFRMAAAGQAIEDEWRAAAPRQAPTAACARNSRCR